MDINIKEISKRKETYIFVTQTLFFLLLAILILRVLEFENDVRSLYSIGPSVIFILLISLIPLLGLKTHKYIILIDISLSIVLVVIITIFLYFEIQEIFKILFLMPVVVFSLRYEKKFSYMFTGLITIIIIALSYKDDFVSIDSDIVLSCIFFLISWLLGSMTQTEAKVREELERLATFDSLTDLLNHRSFQSILDEKIIEAKKNNFALSLLLLDIDHFKIYNDSLGHQKGDIVLKKVANILKAITKDLGYCARYGGEEFVIILPKTKIQMAEKLAEKIRLEIENTKFIGIEVLPKGKITVSIGIAQFPIMAETKEKLIQKADEALYKAKFVSRNKVEVYHSVFDELSLILKNEEQELLNSIRTFTMVINAKDRYTYGHSERTMELCKEFSQYLKLDETLTKDLIYGSLLHDIGKIEIPREVLNKPGKLNDAEWNILRQHPQLGADIIAPLKTLQGSVDVILYHHENYDGTGYPKGLKGIEIPLGARILRIIDSYDAITTNRPYKECMSKNQALEELARFSGTHYDPEILDMFCNMMTNKED
ncbi:MAG: diguanylate cyclase [Peptococcales bacterium]